MIGGGPLGGGPVGCSCWAGGGGGSVAVAAVAGASVVGAGGVPSWPLFWVAEAVVPVPEAVAETVPPPETLRLMGPLLLYRMAAVVGKPGSAVVVEAGVGPLPDPLLGPLPEVLPRPGLGVPLPFLELGLGGLRGFPVAVVKPLAAAARLWLLWRWLLWWHGWVGSFLPDWELSTVVGFEFEFEKIGSFYRSGSCRP